ncbi:MAG: Ig-like domain-containing protein, partial [Clostridiales bacterium]|nr:Ig-like domain-containing protein [Clostridiales bacterium]
MNKKIRLTCAIALLLVLCASAPAACKPKPTPEPEVNPAVTLSAHELTLDIDDVFTLTAAVENFDGAVVWRSSDPSVAAVSGGTVTALKEGTALVSAAAGAVSDSCAVSVVYSGSVPVLRVNTDSVTIEQSAEYPLNAEVMYKGKAVSDAAIAYESADEAVATVGANGKIRGAAVGQTVVTVTAQYKGRQLFETVEVRIRTAVAAAKIPVEISSADVYGGDKPDFFRTTDAVSFTPVLLNAYTQERLYERVSVSYHRANGASWADVEAPAGAGSYRAVFEFSGSDIYEQAAPVTTYFDVLGAQDYINRLLKFDAEKSLSIVTGGLGDAAAIEYDGKAEDNYALKKTFGHSAGAYPLAVQLGSVWMVGEVAELRIRYRLTEITAGTADTFWPRFYFNGTAWDGRPNYGGISLTAKVGQDMADYATLVITQADLLKKYPDYLTKNTALSQIGLLGPINGTNGNSAAMNLDSITVVTKEEAAATYPELLTFKNQDALSIVSGGLDTPAIVPDGEAAGGHALQAAFGVSASPGPTRTLSFQLGSIWTVGEIAEIRFRYRLTDIATGGADSFWPRFSFNDTAWDDTSLNGQNAFFLRAYAGQDMADYETLVMTQAELLAKYPLYLTTETVLSRIVLSPGGFQNPAPNPAVLHLDSITVVTRADKQAAHSELLTFKDQDALSLVT